MNSDSDSDDSRKRRRVESGRRESGRGASILLTRPIFDGAGHPPPPTQVLGSASLLSGTAPLARSSSGTASTPEDTEPMEAKLADNVKACEVVVSMERALCDYVQRRFYIMKPARSTSARGQHYSRPATQRCAIKRH